MANDPISIILYTDERDFLVRFLGHTLPEPSARALAEATANANGLIETTLAHDVLSDILERLQHAATHHPQIWTRDSAYEMVERLEPYSP